MQMYVENEEISPFQNVFGCKQINALPSYSHCLLMDLFIYRTRSIGWASY